MIGCTCKVCKSRNPKNNRTRASAWLRTRGKSILIDTSTDLRQQALKYKIPRVDAILYTHPHADHVHGIDEMRSYNFLQKAEIPAYCNAWTAKELREKFEYIFARGPVEGGGIPQLTIHQFPPDTIQLDVLGVRVVPIALRHGSKECTAYRVDDLAYVTDVSAFPHPAFERLKNLDILILDCVRYKAHKTHLTWDVALDIARQIGARKTYLTHLSHDFDYASVSKKLPKGVFLAYDGLTLQTRRTL